MIIPNNKWKLSKEVYNAIDYLQKEFKVNREEIYGIIMAAGVHSLLSKAGMPTNMNKWKTINNTDDKDIYGR